MITRLWVLVPTRAHCVESLSKTLNPHCSSPPRWMLKIWVPASYHAGKVKQTRLCRRSSVPPQQQKYIVESGLNAKEIEMGTTAESLELRFRLNLYLYLILKWANFFHRKTFSAATSFCDLYTSLASKSEHLEFVNCLSVRTCNKHIISYRTLFQYHTSKQTSIKNTTWYWGHVLKAKKAWDNHTLNKGFNKYTLSKTKTPYKQTEVHKTCPKRKSVVYRQ